MEWLRVWVDVCGRWNKKGKTAHGDQWIEEVGPSTTLRKWVNHEPEKWQPFIKKYHTGSNTRARF